MSKITRSTDLIQDLVNTLVNHLWEQRTEIHRCCEERGWVEELTQSESLRLDLVDYVLTELGFFDTCKWDSGDE